MVDTNEDDGALVEAIAAFAASSANHLWLIADDVYFDQDQTAFLQRFDSCPTDVLSTMVSRVPNPAGPEQLSSLTVLVRLSRRAAAVVAAGFDGARPLGLDAALPTLAARAGLTVEEIGGHGPFTPAERVGLAYDERTWQRRQPVEHVPGRLHHPVPFRTRPLARHRIAESHPTQWSPRLLYASPVGGACSELLPETLARFRAAGVECLLLQYDDSDLDLQPDVRLVRQQGHKWQLAVRHLTPEVVAEYDFVFFWDDDIAVRDFDPLRFVSIMAVNRLDMAQPAIESRHPLSHPITARQSCPPPWRLRGETTSYAVVGRLTNFVEIMVPVFTAGAWRELYEYLDPDSKSGWGADFVPLGRRGIVDVLAVEHTRPVGSWSPEAIAELNRFLDDQGLTYYAPVDEGLLFEPSEELGVVDGPDGEWSVSVTSMVAGGRNFRAIWT
jgi:hypothetical protein